MNTVIFPFLIAFFATILLTPLSLIFIKKAKLFDDPRSHKHPAILHKRPVPRGGGIPLFVGIVFAASWYLPITPITLSIFGAALLSLVVGVMDDKYDISPYIRFAVNIFAASMIVLSGVSIPFVTNPFGGILHLNTTLSNILAILWIVWVMNMLNWSKGVDGQMPGIVAISAFVIGILSLRFSPLDENAIIASLLSFIIAGSSLGFLIYNVHPARIFPGYGATSVYLLLAVVSILSSAKLAAAILVMGVPMVDGVFTVARRIISGHSPFWHDKKHLHHILLDLGFRQQHIAIFYWVISFVLGALSLTLTSTGKFFAIIMLVVIVGGTLIFLHRLSYKNSV